MLIGLVRETRANERRVAITPESARKLISKGFIIVAERGAGAQSGFPDTAYPAEGMQWTDAKSALSTADIVFKVNRPTLAEASLLKKSAVLITQIEPFIKDELLAALAAQDVRTLGLEYLPRISRTQMMDVLSSQANITGYRAVIEAAARFGKFFPLMMTAAGAAKPAKVTILGAGVAGLQAIATARRIGAVVEAYDVRPEVKEQIESLGAKAIQFDLGEDGSGQGGYAKELSEAAKQRQDQLLSERLKLSDIIISTANIPGRKAPVLITEETVKGMRAGSVIIDLAAANGGNCPLTEADQVVEKHGVTLVGFTNFPSLIPTDASNFYANNLLGVLDLIVRKESEKLTLNLDQSDEVIKALLVTNNGAVLK